LVKHHHSGLYFFCEVGSYDSCRERSGSDHHNITPQCYGADILPDELWLPKHMEQHHETIKPRNCAVLLFHVSPVFPETSGKRLGDSDVEAEESRVEPKIPIKIQFLRGVAQRIILPRT
jgi:hypothetical protein